MLNNNILNKLYYKVLDNGYEIFCFLQTIQLHATLTKDESGGSKSRTRVICTNEKASQN